MMEWKLLRGALLASLTNFHAIAINVSSYINMVGGFSCSEHHNFSNKYIFIAFASKYETCLLPYFVFNLIRWGTSSFGDENGGNR